MNSSAVVMAFPDDEIVVCLSDEDCVLGVASSDSEVDLLTPPASPILTPPASPLHMPNPIGELTDAVSAPALRSGGVLAFAKTSALTKRKTYEGEVTKSVKKTSSEPVLAVKLAAVTEAKAKLQLACIESGAFELSSEQRLLYVTLDSLGMQKKRLDYLSGWSARAHSEQWQLLARHERIVRQYGANPMEAMRRIPSWWFSDTTSRVASCPIVIAGDDGDGDEMELWLTKSQSTNVTKATLIQKYAGLEGIIRHFKRMP